jgi:site-specific recombinase XerD
MREPPLAARQPLLPNASGGTLSAHGVQYLLAKHAAAAGDGCPSLMRKRVSPHLPRPTTAMDLLQKGTERRAIALWMGHESIDTTQVYLDADQELKQKVLDKPTPPTGRLGRYHPGDRLLTFLKGL